MTICGVFLGALQLKMCNIYIYDSSCSFINLHHSGGAVPAFLRRRPHHFLVLSQVLNVNIQIPWEVIRIHVYNPTMVISPTLFSWKLLGIHMGVKNPNKKGVISQLIGVIAMQINLSARPPMTMTFLSLASKTFGSVPFFLAPHQRRHLLLTSPPSNSAWLRGAKR